MIKDKIIKALQKIIGDNQDIYLEHPDNEKYGDYASNIALTLFSEKKSGQSFAKFASPRELAEKLIFKLQKDKDLKQVIEKIEAAGPGFINFYLKKDWLLKELFRIAEQKNYGYNQALAGKKIIIEFAHPNTHKAFHIGHLRNIITGESLARILSACGARIIRANYQGDVGMHIAKAVYALLQIADFKKQLPVVKRQDIKARVKFLGKAYAAGSQAFDEDKQAEKIIKDYNYLIYASAQLFLAKQGKKSPKTDYIKFVKAKTADLKQVYKLWQETRRWSLEYFDSVYARVDSHFDRLFFESECLIGVDLAYQALAKGILKKSQGAVVFDGTAYDLDTRVFVNSLGLPTYEGKELALSKMEFAEFGTIDKVIHVVGPEQASFFTITFKVEELIDPKKFKDKQYHLIYGWVRLKKGKMSSRKGNVVLGEWLLDEARNKIMAEFAKLSEKKAEAIAVGAVKYSFLKQGIRSDMAFDFSESISLEGNSGPYLQYTYARCQSVLVKASASIKNLNSSQQKANQEEMAIIRWIYRFPEVVLQAGMEYSPNVIAGFLYELAQRFNTFYGNHRILETDKKDQEFRLLIVKAVALVLKNGLDLLGIKTLKKM